MHMPVELLQSAAVAHGAIPIVTHAVCSALQTSGWAPLQRRAPALHSAALHVPVIALQRAAVSHAVPWLVQPLRPALQICG